MHTIEFQNSPLKLQFPEHLGEYTNEQYLHFCELLTKFQKNKISYQEFSIELTYKLLNMVHSTKKLTIEEQSARNENIYTLSLFINDLFTEKKIDGKLYKTIDLSFIDNKIPSFTINSTVYYGPDDVLLNISFDEFLAAIEHFNNYNKTLDEADLNKLVATLYRPKKEATPQNIISDYDGDIRQEFYASNVNKRAKIMEALPLYKKIGIKLFFEACINYISTAESVNVMGNEIDLSVLFKGEASKDKGIGMLNVLFTLAETNVFGNKKETGRERYWTILLKLFQNHIDIEKQKKAVKDAKRNTT